MCYLLALLGAHHFLHVSRIKVKLLTFRRLMSYIYIYDIGHLRVNLCARYKWAVSFTSRPVYPPFKNTRYVLKRWLGVPQRRSGHMERRITHLPGFEPQFFQPVFWSPYLSHVLTYLLTYLLTPWSRVLLEKFTGFQLVKNFPAFYGTRRFITAVTSARHFSLSWASSIQLTPPHPSSWISILILSFHLRQG